MAAMNLGSIISELQRRETESATRIGQLQGELRRTQESQARALRSLDMLREDHRRVVTERNDLERKAGRHAADAEGLRIENGKLVRQVTELRTATTTPATESIARRYGMPSTDPLMAHRHWVSRAELVAAEGRIATLEAERDRLTAAVNGELNRTDYVRGEEHRMYVDRVAEQDVRLSQVRDRLSGTEAKLTAAEQARDEIAEARNTLADTVRELQSEVDTLKGQLERTHQVIGIEITRQLRSPGPMSMSEAAMGMSNALRIVRLSTELRAAKKQRGEALARLERFGKATAESITLLEGCRSWAMQDAVRSRVGNAIGVLDKAQAPQSDG